MTAKEQAENLFFDFFQIVENNSYLDKGKQIAKQATYLCTEKIIQCLYDLGERDFQNWYDIQNQIDNL